MMRFEYIGEAVGWCLVFPLLTMVADVDAKVLTGQETGEKEESKALNLHSNAILRAKK